MGHRLSKITTKTGDGGTTGLGDGSRVPKTHPRIAAIGEVDELNCVVGLLLTETLSDQLRESLVDVQHDLFDLGGELSIPGYTAIGETHVARLEALSESLNAELPMLKDFILPGGSRAAAYAHLVRTVCRRAERAVLVLAASETVSDYARVYLNRLSDLAFVLARTLNRAAGQPDVLWRKDRRANATPA
ncbi:MAG TPA: cob(I)yrinic acid a,c-diamide adenosyltransferase [Casimicrobium huifangae]|jgi:cob(I)alamin adenosyltransferase|uniref:cob(I)yrinic acid a,c-diamide adenosyltransferase n=1 Tax=Casimicrobium huifangae TaxID=2591109 RepID=UPI002B8FF189|nr:cob(I)yrinic acid a,c-diamide adenosyltransferase [Casimicrobium huifangae]HQA33537.1 cob(I)yrinic acid a,c-diamide adenosyltransferase [Casimicrobium huifangae]HQD64498.1 cob(I)yrinic acid a,c-diamide adenosyltransferase [Casimicrobium huifangae]